MKKLIAVVAIMLLIAFGITFNATKESKKETHISFASWGSQSEVVILKSLISEFEKENPDIKVDFMHIPQNYFPKIHLLFASKLAPDIIFMNNIYAPVYIKAGLLEDLRPYFKDEIKNKVFYGDSVKSFSRDGATYGIPRDISYMVIYYNKGIFDKTKTPYPNSDWTLDDFLKTAQKVRTKDNFSINFEDNSLFWLNYLSSLNGGIFSDGAHKIILDSTQSIEGLDFYRDLIFKYHLMPTKAEMYSKTGAQMFINGNLAMYLSGRWMVPKFREVIIFDWDIANFPSKGGKIFNTSSAWTVSKSSKNKEAAVKFIKFISSEKASEEFAKSGLIVPARIKVAESNIFLAQQKSPKHSEYFINELSSSKPLETNENYNQINDIINEALEPVFNGTKPVQDAVTKDLIYKLNKLL